MKRTGYLFEKICDMDNLRLAHHNARHGKGWYREVKMIERNLDYYLLKLRQSLLDHTYHTSEYQTFIKRDTGKERRIYKLPYYPDRICQWAIMQVIAPILLRTMTVFTYSAIPTRGPHKVLKHLRHAMLYDSKNCTYCLKFDVKHYYPSITHELLKLQLRRLFKDSDLLWVLDEIIDSVATATQEDAENTGYPEAAVGVPIGNYLSQWAGNLYLTKFDHWLKEIKKLPYCYRYMDDVVILHKDKQYLHELRKEITEHLRQNTRLTVKGNWQVFPTYVRGVDYVGYRVFANYVLLRKSTKLKMIRKLKAIQNKGRLSGRDFRCIMSYVGILKYCNSYYLRQKYLAPLLPRAAEYLAERRREHEKLGNGLQHCKTRSHED